MSQLENSPISQGVDEDILQTRNDVLRAKDIFPPYDIQNQTEKDSENADTDNNNLLKNFPLPNFDQSHPIKETVIEAAESIAQELSAESEIQQEENSDKSIPTFDLGMQILANQRKKASTMRKGPGSSVTSPPPAIEEPIEISEPVTETTATDNLENTEINDTIIEELIEPEAPEAVEDTQDKKELVAIESIEDNYEDSDPFKDVFQEEIQDEINVITESYDNFEDENHNFSTHISNITKPRLTRTQESIISDIVARDIEQFLKSA